MFRSYSDFSEREVYRVLPSADGVTGTVDLSHLAGKGVFALWDDYAAFERVYVGESGEIAWTEEIDLCPDALYVKITGKTPEQLFPNLKVDKVSA